MSFYKKNLLGFLLVAFFCVFIFSCKKENKFITSVDAKFRTSIDTLKYDTVFTTVGSITKSFKIFNPNNKKLLLNNVQLKGGAASFYKMNVDGLSGTQFSNIEVEANDSLYVFISVNVNPNASNIPFIIQDSVLIQYNENSKFVQLQAYGQNAIFLKNYKLTGNVIWNNTLPYVIIGAMQIDTTATLTINEGTKIYLHSDASFIVDGTLLSNGKKWDSTKVKFTGDRLDEPYKDFPATWPGIYFRGQSKNNTLNFTNISNAYQALVTEGPSINANPKIVLNECIINNAFDAGILSLNSSITAKNCLITNCGNNIGIVLGGNYNFNHCTIASYSNSNILHKNPVLVVTNYNKINNIIFTNSINAVFNNCIFWGEFGTVEDEVVADKLGTSTFNVSFNKCLYKVKTSISPLINSIGGIVNSSPQFDSINVNQRKYNFRLKPTSPAINAGSNSTTLIDLDGNPRPVGLPDLGCYEKQ